MRFGLREIIFLLVLLAVPAASWMYLFKPQNDDILRVETEIADKQTKLDMLENRLEAIEDIGLAIDRGRDSIELIEAKLPNEQDVEGILEQVWQLAKRNHLIVKSVKSQNPVPAALYMELPLEVTMEGGFDGYYQFLLDLESLKRITRIHEMQLERLDELGDDNEVPPGAMRAEFTLSIYFETRDGAASA